MVRSPLRPLTAADYGLDQVFFIRGVRGAVMEARPFCFARANIREWVASPNHARIRRRVRPLGRYCDGLSRLGTSNGPLLRIEIAPPELADILRQPCVGDGDSKLSQPGPHILQTMARSQELPDLRPSLPHLPGLRTGLFSCVRAEAGKIEFVSGPFWHLLIIRQFPGSLHKVSRKFPDCSQPTLIYRKFPKSFRFGGATLWQKTAQTL